MADTIYRYEVVAWGRDPHERIQGVPTDAELREAVVVVVRYTNLMQAGDVQYYTIRHPRGFGLRQRLPMEDLEFHIGIQADRYLMEIVSEAP